MTNITKPIGKRNRLVSKEEAKAMLEKIEVPKSALEEAFDLVHGSEEDDVIDFHGFPLVRHERDTLDVIAQTYFTKSAENYFDNFDKVTEDVYLKIKDKHVVRLYMDNQNLRKIPEEIKLLTKLKKLHLLYNNIQLIENLDELEELEFVHLSGNLIPEHYAANEDVIKKLKNKGVDIYYD